MTQSTAYFSCFNLAIEKLLFSTYGDETTLQDISSFNLAIEKLLFSTLRNGKNSSRPI